MTDAPYVLENFVADLRRIDGEADGDREVIRQVTPLALRLAENSAAWLEPGHRMVDEAQGFSAHLLHEEDNHRLAVFAVAWTPGIATPPHDHGTWAVVAGIDGAERNVNWRRKDDGSRPGHAEIVAAHEITVNRGDVINFMPDDIHSVHNDTDGVTLSLHVYGKHVNHTDRSQFDPETNSVAPFKLPMAD